MKEDNRTNNDTTQKTTDRATRTLLKTTSEIRPLEGLAIPGSHVAAFV